MMTEQKSFYEAVFINDCDEKMNITDWGNGFLDFVSKLGACAWKPKKILSVRYLYDCPAPTGLSVIRKQMVEFVTSCFISVCRDRFYKGRFPEIKITADLVRVIKQYLILEIAAERRIVQPEVVLTNIFYNERENYFLISIKNGSETITFSVQNIIS